MTNTAIDAKPRVGHRMRDGTVYAGISPNTHQPMYAMPADAPLTYTFYQAEDYARKLGRLFHKSGAGGHKDWRVPTKDELNVIFKHCTAIGGFNVTGSGDASCYWSSSQHPLSWRAWGQRFSDGSNGFGNNKGNNYLSLRCVRG